MMVGFGNSQIHNLLTFVAVEHIARASTWTGSALGRDVDCSYMSGT